VPRGITTSCRVFEAGKPSEENPAEAWKALSARQQKLCDGLNQCSTIRYTGVDTDLTFRCRGRTWINCDGKLNLPDGEVFTGPVEDSVNGAIRFTFPGIFQGQEVEDIFLRFKNGKVEEAGSVQGEDLLHKLLHTDAGSSYVGEIAIGTNDQVRHFFPFMRVCSRWQNRVATRVRFGRYFAAP
jgi:aminopeptidase